MAEIQRIFMFHTGRAHLRRGLLEAGAGAERCWLPVLCFLLDHPDEGPILVDTGFGERAITQSRRWWGRLLGSFLGRPLSVGCDCRARIAECGFDPDAVPRGVLTHLHWDHTGGLRDLPDTRFVVARRELDAARAVAGLRAVSRGYAPGDLDQLDRLEAIDYDAADDLAPFDAAHDLLGDGSVRLVPTPGHSPGHSSVFVRATAGREVLLVGDAAFTQGHVLGHVDLGLMPRTFAADLQGARDTLHKLRTFVKRRPGLRVYTSHDPDQGDDVSAGPLDILQM